MATIPRSSPARGAPRCSPLGSRAKSVLSPDSGSIASRSLVFQPQLLDSMPQEERPRLDSEPQARRSMIPSPSKQKRQPSHHSIADSDAEHEDTASSTTSASSIVNPENFSALKPVLGGNLGLSDKGLAEAGEPLGSAITNQVFEGSGTPEVVIVVLSSGDAKAKALQSFSMTADDTTADLKKLFSNPSFLKGLRSSAAKTSSIQGHKKGGLSFAATAITIVSCAVIGLSLIQQYRIAPWQSVFPA